MKAVLHRMLVIATLLGAARSHAAPVTYWFAGTITRVGEWNDGLPSGIQVGTTFNGRIQYEPGKADAIVPGVSTNIMNYYYRLPSEFSFWMQIGGHVVTNSAEFKKFQWSGNIGILNGIDGTDRYSLEIGNNGLVTDGLADTNSYIDLKLTDNSQTAVSSSSMPVHPPDLAAYPDGRVFFWLSYDPSTQKGFQLDGKIDQISRVEIVTLNIRRKAPDSIQFAWPLAVSAARLQSATAPSGGDWQDVLSPVEAVGMEHTVTVPSSSPQTYYRLALPQP